MCNTSIINGTCYNQNCTYVHAKGTKRYKADNDLDQSRYQNSRTDYEIKTNIQKNFNNEPQNLNFLELLGNFKKEIIEDFDLKLAKIMSMNQHQPQPKPLMQTPTYLQTRPYATQNYYPQTTQQIFPQHPIQLRRHLEDQFQPQHNIFHNANKLNN